MNMRKLRHRARQVMESGKQKRRGRTRDAHARHLARHLKIGTIFETCGCDVARVVSIDPNRDDIVYESLTHGGQGSCSLIHCGPLPLRPEAIQRRLAIYKQGGMEALFRRYFTEDGGMTEQDYDEWKQS